MWCYCVGSSMATSVRRNDEKFWDDQEAHFHQNIDTEQTCTVPMVSDPKSRLPEFCIHGDEPLSYFRPACRPYHVEKVELEKRHREHSAIPQTLESHMNSH